MAVEAKRPLALRVSAGDLDEITRLARRHGLSRTQYIVDASLGRLSHLDIEQRLNALDDRIARCEQFCFGE